MSNLPAASQTVLAPFSFLDRLARHLVTKQLAGLRRGRITVCDASESISFGEPADLRVTLRVNRPRFFRRAVLGGTLSVAESYLNGDWECDDLTSLFQIFVRNRDSANVLDGGLAKLASVGHRLLHWWRANTRTGSRRNIGAHYDLGNDFFSLWLDDTMAYSSGIFPSAGASLRDASAEKFDRVCRKLGLRPSDQVLEIGTGWGGFAIHAAKNYGCHVTTTTISREQFEVAQQRIKEAGLASQVTLLPRDYRDLRGQFDKLVSIEMIEAVGYRFLDEYFRQCGRLLRPDGSLVLQAIVMPERGYGQYLKSVDFIQRYVFPGGCLPSLGAILASTGRATDLRFVHAEDFAPHYAETLRRWRRAFHMRLDDVRRLGYSDEFIRMWNYYLCYCEAAFEERHVGVLQIQFDKPDCRRDPIDLGGNHAEERNPAEQSWPHAPSRRNRSMCGKWSTA
jgi:cyclopropane-fatty-acyl-phospholipid synthase